MANLINISSVVAESVNADQLQVVARWKSTEKKEVSPANRQRAVILPYNIWSEQLHSDNKPLQGYMHDAVTELAKEFLSTICEESGWQRTQVPLEAFNLDSLLAWNAERAAMSGRLSSEEIKKWVGESATIKSIREAKSEKHATVLGEVFCKLAGPNHGVTPEQATKIMGELWQADDSDHITGIRVFQRLKNIANPKTIENAVKFDDLF